MVGSDGRRANGDRHFEGTLVIITNLINSGINERATCDGENKKGEEGKVQ